MLPQPHHPRSLWSDVDQICETGNEHLQTINYTSLTASTEYTLTVAIGARTAHLFVICITPLNPLTSRVPIAVLAPGNVSAIMVGNIVCMVKKTGKVAVCKVAN